MKDGGYFKLYRRAFRDVDHGGDPLWNEKRVWSRAEAWLYLLSIAAYDPHDKPLKAGRSVHLERGEFYASLRYLARRWGWSKSKVARFLEQLGTGLERITRKNRDTDGDTYLVNNFEYYQGSGTGGGTRAGHRRDTGGTKDKKEEEGRRKDPERPNDPFETFWMAYPKKVKKLDAKKAWEQMARERPPLDVLLASLAALKDSGQWQDEGGRYVPYPGTWLRGGGWDDEPQARQPKSPTLFPVSRIAARRADASEPSTATVRTPKGW